MTRTRNVWEIRTRQFSALSFRTSAYTLPAHRASIVLVLALWGHQWGTATALVAHEPQSSQSSSMTARTNYRPINAIFRREFSSGRYLKRPITSTDQNLVTPANLSRTLTPGLPRNNTELPGMPIFATDAEAVGTALAAEAHQRLQEGDLLVVWLLDSSRSMAASRNQPVLGLDSFFQHFAHKSGTSHQLLNAAVSFGPGMRELAAPTDSPARVLEAVRELPPDSTGVENTFDAIGKCAASYRKHWPDHGLLVIAWTDEAGDDSRKLEETILKCLDHQVSVTVVGPMGALGSEIATEPIVDQVMHETHRLPVTRGPDSAFPQRLKLGYWFLTQPPELRQHSDRGFTMEGLPSWFGAGNRDFGDHRCIAATQVDLPTWHGDADLDGLVSGFGPYALTRLAVQTGGAYIILADGDHAGPYQPDMLKDYLPDYRSIDAYKQSVESSPLRHAVTEAVRTTQRNELGPPPTLLFGQRSETPPYGFMRDYYTPERFANKVRMLRRRLKTEAGRSSRIVEQALEQVSSQRGTELGLEEEYEQEPSHRWRAWYDLTRGRLLATSVRLEEYRKTYEVMVEPGFLEQTTNFAVFVPSRQMKSGSTYRFRAEEAERLLLRCVRENPNTPWALLAQRELDYGLGIDVLQFATFFVMMPPSKAREPLVLPKL